MAVAYDSYEAKVLELAIAMLAGSSTFQTLTSTASVAAAKAYIVESFGGDLRDLTAQKTVKTIDGTVRAWGAPLAIVHLEEMTAEPVAHLTYDYSGVVATILNLPRTDADAPAEHFRRARNTLGGIRTDMQALVGTAGHLAEAHISSEGPIIPDISGPNAAFLQGQLLIDWRG